MQLRIWMCHGPSEHLALLRETYPVLYPRNSLLSTGTSRSVTFPCRTCPGTHTSGAMPPGQATGVGCRHRPHKGCSSLSDRSRSQDLEKQANPLMSHQGPRALTSVLIQSWVGVQCGTQGRSLSAQGPGAVATPSEWGKRVWGCQSGLHWTGGTWVGLGTLERYSIRC